MAEVSENVVQMTETNKQESENTNNPKAENTKEKKTENELKPVESVNSTNKVILCGNMYLYRKESL